MTVHGWGHRARPGTSALGRVERAVSDTDSQENGRTEAARALLARPVKLVHLGDATLNRKVVAAEGRAANGVNLLLSLGAVVLRGAPGPAVSVSPGFVRDADQQVPPTLPQTY